VAAILTAGSPAVAGPYIAVEAVRDYSTTTCTSIPESLAQAENDATNFVSQLTAPAWNPYNDSTYSNFNYAGLAKYTLGQYWTNHQVWTSDFYDPQKTGLTGGGTGDHDDQFFDAFKYAFSYYVGHGMCQHGIWTCDTEAAGGCGAEQRCTSAADCTNPDPAWYGVNPGFCKRLPGDTGAISGGQDWRGSCSYPTNNRTLLLENCSNGPSGRGGQVNYSSGNVKWGESAWSTAVNGNWSGAGTNGGTNFVVLNTSCAEMSMRQAEIFPVFGGVHVLATVVVHTGDTRVWAYTGYNFAHLSMNHYLSPADAWNTSINSAPLTEGRACADRYAGTGSPAYGGFKGYDGCGAHKATALGSTAVEAWNLYWATFRSVALDRYDATGAAYYFTAYTCNYDCNNWPMSFP
jgi:hypothetical protein